tara:strand:- start:829 stop:1230 length:402 start_codon:yes stop_codon:yes gene_type:complete
MILGIGNDIVDIRRIEKAFDRYGMRFADRCFTSHEQKKAQKRESAGTHYDVYAKRFAAKEACAKALGTGFSKNIRFKEIGIVENEDGRPFLELSGAAKDQLETITPNGMKAVLHLSLSDEPPCAQAFVVIEAR